MSEPTLKKTIPEVETNKFALVERERMTSPAFLSLRANGTAIIVLLTFLAKRRPAKKEKSRGRPKYGERPKHVKFVNEDNLTFRYSEAEALGIDGSSFWRAIIKLRDVGFIDIVEHGSYLDKATVYALSTRWAKFGTPEFVPSQNKNKKALPDGLGFQRGNQHGRHSKIPVTRDSKPTVTRDSKRPVLTVSTDSKQKRGKNA